MLNSKQINTLISEIKIWADYNFDTHTPELGLIEEIGEYAHQLCKKKQGIRETSEADEKDALADIAIYFLHMCSIYNYTPEQIGNVPTLKLEWHLGQLTHAAGKILCDIAMESPPSTLYMYSLWEQLNVIFHLNMWKIEEIVYDVWNKVNKRDWRKYPQTGFPHGESLAN